MTQSLKSKSLLAAKYFWLAMTVSLVGDHIYRVAMVWTLTERGGMADATRLGIAIALPSAFFAIAGGVLADRTSRTRILILSDIGRAALGLLLVAIVARSFDAVGFYLAIAAFLAAGTAIFLTAHQAMIPELAHGDRDLLIKIDAWFVGTMNSLRVIGPLIAGLAMARIPLAGLFLCDAISFVLSAVLIALARRSMPPDQGHLAPNAPRRPPFNAAAALEGVRFVTRHSVLRPFALSFPIADIGFFALPFLLPHLLQGAGDESAFGYAGLLSANAVGRVVGNVMIGRLSFLRGRRGPVIAANFFVQGAGIAAFLMLYQHSFVLALAAFFVAGVPAGCAQVAFASYVQLEVPPERRGRVFGGLMMLTTAAPPLLFPLLGMLATSAGAGWSIGVIAMSYVACGAYLSRHQAVRAIA